MYKSFDKSNLQKSIEFWKDKNNKRKYGPLTLKDLILYIADLLDVRSVINWSNTNKYHRSILIKHKYINFYQNSSNVYGILLKAMDTNDNIILRFVIENLLKKEIIREPYDEVFINRILEYSKLANILHTNDYQDICIHAAKNNNLAFIETIYNKYELCFKYTVIAEYIFMHCKIFKFNKFVRTNINNINIEKLYDACLGHIWRKSTNMNDANAKLSCLLKYKTLNSEEITYIMKNCMKYLEYDINNYIKIISVIYKNCKEHFNIIKRFVKKSKYTRHIQISLNFIT